MNLLVQGLAIALAPLSFAWLYALLHGESMWDEASGGGGFIWLLMLSVPLGLGWVIFGLFLSLLRRTLH